MLQKDILLIINPNASKGKGRHRAHEIRELLAGYGRACTVAYTREPGHARNLARRGASYGYRVIVAAGGDGTVNEVLNGIMHSGVSGISMGIIPIGRGNDFAWMAGIPCDIEQAVHLIARRQARKIDVGYLEGGRFPSGRYFLNGTGFGFEPAINFKAGEYRHLNGMPSYIVAFFHCLLHLPASYKVKMTIDGKEFNFESQQISVSNGRRMGSAFILAPHAVLDDGLLDIVFSNRPVVRREVIPMVFSFFRGTQLEKCSFMQEERGREVIIESAEDNMKIHTDGELVSLSAGRCLVRLLPSSLNLHYTRSSF